ncbi:MAG: DUF5916 domain-containing protein [Planctomycetota bacterium]
MSHRPACKFARGLVALAFAGGALTAQEPGTPELRVVRAEAIAIDGRLDEPAWAASPGTDAFRTTEPLEGALPNGRTVLRVLVDDRALYIGVRCFDPSPADIVAHVVARDADLSGEDHVRIVLGTFLDGRTGYVFAVNPRGARYDALVAGRGEFEDDDWDGPWEAKATVDAEGWSVEIRLPVTMLAFAEGADVWHCNVERKVQRLLERSRWANPHRDQRITNLAKAGHLVGMPRFETGLGLAVRGAAVGRATKESASAPTDYEAEPSADVTWRITPQWASVLTLNTDFSETEVDARRTNLTRFPLFFPEKRPFFLEGKDAFDFGLGLGESVLPFQSRRIGLVGGRTVPLHAGAKVLGRTGGTSVGALVANTGEENGVAPASTMGVVRVRQDVLAQSNVGILATSGDPLGDEDAWLGGADATYQTSELFGGRNFLVGVWGLTMDRSDLAGTASAYGAKIDYPNDDWDVNLYWRHVDEQFAPPLGFVARPGIELWHFGVDRVFRPDNGWLRKQAFESGADWITDLDGRWVSWSVFAAVVNAEFESGDGVEFNLFPQGERLDADFEIGDGVVIPPGTYEWLGYRAVVSTAEKRAVAAEVQWRSGDFYDGRLDRWEIETRSVVSSWLTVRANADLVRGRLPQGDFAEDVFGVTLGCTFSPDLTLDSFLQYDTESDSLGTNTRLRWDLTPASQVFFVVNYNALAPGGTLTSDARETVLKVQHEVRF